MDELTPKEKKKIFLNKAFNAAVQEHELDLTKVFERAVDAAGWCALNMEVAFLAREIEKLQAEIVKLKEGGKEDDKSRTTESRTEA